jgi:lipopolysaccharide export system permease protein
MRILDRYVAHALLKGYAIILLILLSMFSILALVQELEDVGDGNYQIYDAIIYVGLTLPQRLLDLAPVTVLLGGLLALGLLRRGSELIAMQISGVSVYRFGWSVAKLNMILVVILVLCNQFVIPPLSQLAEKQRIVMTKGNGHLLKGKGYWARDKQQIIHFKGMWQGQVPSRIELYKFDNTGRLITYINADRAHITGLDDWQLINVNEKNIKDNSIKNTTYPVITWKSFLKTNQLAALQLPISSLSPTGLYQYTRHLQETGQKYEHIQLIFWQKVLSPLGVVVMALVAVPFALGSGNNLAAGGQLVLGTIVGVLFFLLGQIISGLGQLVGLSPLLIAIFPLAVIAMFAVYLYIRVVRR